MIFVNGEPTMAEVHWFAHVNKKLFLHRPKFGRQNSAVIEEADGGRKIKLEFNLEGFNPEDLSLKVTPENTLKIEAIHEEAKGGSTSKREFR